MEILVKGVLPAQKHIGYRLGTCCNCGCRVKVREDDGNIVLYDDYEIECPTVNCFHNIYLVEYSGH